MTVKTTEIKRWEVALDGDGDGTVAALVVNSIDGDENRVVVRLGTERTVSVEDWLAFVNAIAGKVKYVATR